MDVPFRIGQRVTGQYFTDRSKEVTRIREAMSGGGRLLVYGERRLGKSSAIAQAARRIRRDGGLVLWADVSTSSGFGDIARRLISDVPWKWKWREALQEALTRAQLRVEARTDPTGDPVLGLSLRQKPMDPEHGLDELRRVVAVLDTLARKRSIGAVAVVLDEFQEVVEIQARGDWILRDIIQTSSELAFICAGSKRRVIDDILSADGAFHRFFEPLAFGPIDPKHLARWIESRLGKPGLDCERGVGKEVVTLAGGRTEDAVRLARAVFLGGLKRGKVTIADVTTALATASLEDHHRYQRLWNNLARSQQSVLRALAAGEEKIYGQAARETFGLGSSGTTRNAIRALQDAALLTELDRATIDDPYFRQWILIRAMPSGPELR